MAQSSPRRRGGMEAVAEEKAKIGADVCGFSSHFVFVLRSMLILSIYYTIELSISFFYESRWLDSRSKI